jgi:hypothetical protein
MNNMHLPVSIGEAMDKLTILDIKRSYIKDSRLNEIMLEYNTLHTHLFAVVDKYKLLYESMKKVNLLIWNLMDQLRDGTLVDDFYVKLCKETIELNDVRFRIKNKINIVSDSALKEQKGYKVNSVLIIINNENTLLKEFILPINYYSYLYDETIVICENTVLINEFKDDPTVRFVNEIKHVESFKQIFRFPNEKYSKEEILLIFNIDENKLNRLL